MLDGNGETRWCEGGGKGGAGEWLEFGFGERVSIQMVRICTGDCQGLQQYRESGAVLGLTLDFGDGREEKLELKDFPLPQPAYLQEVRTADEIRLIVDSVRSGPVHGAVCLSDVLFFE